MRDTALGRTEQSLALAREVEYLEPGRAWVASVVDPARPLVPRPYGSFNLENQWAARGVVSTAIDVLRFALTFDRPGVLLSQASLDRTFARPEGLAGYDADGMPRSSYFGLGWYVRPTTTSSNAWHFGRFAGSQSLMVRRGRSLAWVLLFNQGYDRNQEDFQQDADRMLHRAADAIDAWPSNDLFGRF
jgi:hypothetical protein